MPNGATDQRLDDLFPVPTLPPSQLSPQRLPGASLESLAALQDVLKDNHKRHHIFFNDRGFHNHITHRALAIYALGGPAAVIKEYYKRDANMQRPAFESPATITEENFVDHLGNEKFYQAYVAFFSRQVSEKGARSTLEEFVFTEKHNVQMGRNANTQPEMLGRLFNGLFHPLIHVGYGLEFGIKGMLVEGLAMAAVHHLWVTESLPASFFTHAPANRDVVEHVTNRPLSFTAMLDVPFSDIRVVHAFDIAARVLKDDRLSSKVPAHTADQYMELLIKYTPIVREYAEHWTINLNSPGEVERKMEELIWLSSLLYGVGGLKPSGHQSDFFMMHFVTSSLFLPSIIMYLSPRSQVLLLRGYLVTVLAWWVMRGLPALNIKSFMTTTSVVPSVPTGPPSETPLTIETTPTPNVFLPILQSAITHPNDHLVKIQRAFAHFDTIYGRRPAGYFKGTELEDSELLDGSLFLRCALLTADSVGWVREGDEPRQFGREGFYA